MTVTLAPAARRRPVVRLRSAPPLDPPYDDERSGDTWPTCLGQLEHHPATVKVATAHDPASAAAPSPLATPAAEASRNTAHRFLFACVEVLNGLRPIAHLRPLTAPAEYVAVTDQLTGRAARSRMSPLVAPKPGVRRGLRLRQLFVSEPCAGIVEAAGVVGNGERSFAMAVRLEHRRERWFCTLLQII